MFLDLFYVNSYSKRLEKFSFSIERFPTFYNSLLMFTVPVPLNSIAVQMTIICFVLPLSFWEHKENQYFYRISPLTALTKL